MNDQWRPIDPNPPRLLVIEFIVLFVFMALTFYLFGFGYGGHKNNPAPIYFEGFLKLK